MSDVPPTGALLVDTNVLISAHIAGILPLLGGVGVWTTDEILGETYRVSRDELMAAGIKVARSQAYPDRIIGLSVKDSALLRDAQAWGCNVGTGDRALFNKCAQHRIEAETRVDLFARLLRDAYRSGQMSGADVLETRRKLRNHPTESDWYESHPMREVWRLVNERTD